MTVFSDARKGSPIEGFCVSQVKKKTSDLPVCVCMHKCVCKYVYIINFLLLDDDDVCVCLSVCLCAHIHRDLL